MMSSIHDMPPPPVASATPATENPRPILKLNTSSRQPSFGGDGATPTPSTEKKIRIKVGSRPGTPSLPPTPHASSATKTKAGRTSKPTAKLAESKKRGYDSDEDRPLSVTRAESRPAKAIKLTHKSTHKVKAEPGPPQPATPISAIRFKPKGEPVPHKLGDAYDSEASDREDDPHRETNFVLRVMDGEPAEYLKRALAEGTLGPKSSGGADFAVQFIDGRERRAMVTINGIHYAAVLVQLPTITEAMKTWDRKNMMKNSDVTEMLLCFAVVADEAEAKAVLLPPMVSKSDLKWPHGITPPMHDAPNRRFRKTLSERQWERTQNQVTKLLEDDAAADEVRTEVIIEEDGDDEYDEEEDAEGEDEEDAEGEVEPDDYFGDQTQQDVDMDAEAETEIKEEDLLREFLAEDDEFANSTPATQMEAPTPMTMGATTPMPPQEEHASEDEEDEEEDISDEDDDDDEEGDDDDGGQDRERKQQLSELHELQKQLREAEEKLQTSTMPIIKKRILGSIESFKKEISVKKAALGLTEEE
ncbi:TAFII55 protein conserved region-domain-containing protein [Nemania sp. FL0916]|nr:TAFII55 protein conserved region-domain-containing protein [Nemania sp. FL0916]